MDISDFLSTMSGWVWGPPLMIMLVGTGLYLTWILGGVQFFAFKRALQILRGDQKQRNAAAGEISHYKALMTALSATVGTGNIVGVAAAILTGGPGAVFWMWVTAIVGMATKFASCTLAVRYRKFSKHNVTMGGPMYFIEMGMGPQFKWLAVLFASFTVLASFGIGNMFQVNSIVSGVQALTGQSDIDMSAWGRWLIGGGVAFLTATVIIGGIQRIAKVTAVLVPAMCGFYFVSGLVILISHWQLLDDGFRLIITQAFQAPESVQGGLIGGVIRAGVARGLFSNEAGLGSAPMAHSAAQTDQPVSEGLVAMLGPFIDTLVICSITALVIICTGGYLNHEQAGTLTAKSFELGLPGSGWVVACGMILFAFSTLIAWSYYGDRAVGYLFSESAVKPYRWVYIACILIGALHPLNDVINFCDIMNGLMAIPNLVALLAMASVVRVMTKTYFQK